MRSKQTGQRNRKRFSYSPVLTPSQRNAAPVAPARSQKSTQIARSEESPQIGTNNRKLPSVLFEGKTRHETKTVLEFGVTFTEDIQPVTSRLRLLDALPD